MLLTPPVFISATSFIPASFRVCMEIDITRSISLSSGLVLEKIALNDLGQL